ncbi:hypothetical protein [Acaricomes phytoseiuli]|uniref:hypothetical protein n=1 Tax=Acaricomes phytoseiuli TaxID=291968 RepID=UPI00036EFA6E|nr:hypothetical protein [Acaricomes phytoseiuli]
MYRVYATKADLEKWMSPDMAPDNAVSLLSSASALVEDATLTAIYTTKSDGMPRNKYISGAFRDATCEQAKFWATNGLDPEKDAYSIGARAGASSKSIAGASFSYDSTELTRVTRAKLAALQTLCPNAARILRNAGLLTTTVQS